MQAFNQRLPYLIDFITGKATYNCQYYFLFSIAVLNITYLLLQFPVLLLFYCNSDYYFKLLAILSMAFITILSIAPTLSQFSVLCSFYCISITYIL